MLKLNQRPSGAFLVASLALVVSLGGTSYAALALAPNSVKSIHIKAGAVKTSDLANNAVKSNKVKNGTLGLSDLSPAARNVQRVLRSGETMRGTYTAGGASGTSGYIGTGITFPNQLPGNFVKTNVEYIDGAPSAFCPGEGQAAPGYACFYEGQSSSTTVCCIYDEEYNDPAVGTFGVRMYWNVDGSGSYADGTWAITAP